MDLRDYWYLLRRGWMVVLVATLACLVVGVTLTVLSERTYESRAKLFVSNIEEDPTQAYRGGLFASMRVMSYADLVTSQELAQRVVEQLDLDPSEVESVVELVEAEVLPGTVNLEITASGPSPQEAQRLAQAYADQLPLLIDELETTPGGGEALLKATVVNDATLPAQPVSPDPVRNVALALSLGLLIGAGVVVARDLVNSRVRTARHASETTGAPVLAGLPRRPDAGSPGLASTHPASDHSEAVRVLRTSVNFLEGGDRFCVHMVTSPTPVASKSSTAVDLALALAEEDRRVLLVDADLREPRVASMLRLEGDRGLTSVVAGGADVDAVLQHPAGSTLTVLTSGPLPPNPSEVLGSAPFRALLDSLRDHYDVVVVDAPALLPVTDAALLGPTVDGALLVVEHNSTTEAALRAASARLTSARARISGIVLTQVPPHQPQSDFGPTLVRS